MGYWSMSDRVLLVKPQGQPFNFSIIVVYAPTSDSSDDDIENFYKMLDKAKAQCKSQELALVIGDLNAKVGKEQSSEVTGHHGLGERNEQGNEWVQWCSSNGQVITNTWFEKHPHRLWTRKSPGGDTKNQIELYSNKQTLQKRYHRLNYKPKRRLWK